MEGARGALSSLPPALENLLSKGEEGATFHRLEKDEYFDDASNDA